MTKREAKRLAWLKASSWLQALLDAGYPYLIVDDQEPEESEEDLERLEDAMREVVGFCEMHGRRAA